MKLIDEIYHNTNFILFNICLYLANRVRRISLLLHVGAETILSRLITAYICFYKQTVSRDQADL